MSDLAVANPAAASRQFEMLAYGELRERTLLAETVTKEMLTATVGRAVALFVAGYAVTIPGPFSRPLTPAEQEATQHVD